MPAEIQEVVEPESEEVLESESADAEADANFGQAYNSSAMPSPARGNAIRRQAASVQRQLGGRRSGDGFFVSNWFTDSPSGVGGGASDDQMAANFEAPGDCDPLDPSIAEAYIRDSALREGVSLDLVREIVRRESGFKPCALSPKGAMGMMQLMPDTAVSLGVSDPYDARENIDGGVRLIKRLLDKYNGRPDLALAAYNAGEGSVDSANGIPAFAETREYVAAIMKKVFDTPINRSGRRSPGRRSIPSTGIGASGMAKPTSPTPESREIPPIGDAEPLPNTHN